MKILLGDFNAKVGREDIFKPTIGNESLHEISNDLRIRVVDIATSKNLRVKSTMFSHRNIHKYTWTSPDGKTRNQIDHSLVDRRRHSSVLDVRLFRAADCDTDHYLVVAKVRERLALNKQRSQRLHMERFNLKKLNEVEGKEQYHIAVSNKESLGHYALRKHKPWFDEGCSKLVDQREQAKSQRVHVPSELNGANVNNVKREANRQFRNKKREYLKDKINELATNSKNKNIKDLYRGIN
jgi:hypothetical protein